MKGFIVFGGVVLLAVVIYVALLQGKSSGDDKQWTGTVVSQPPGNPAIHNVNLRIREDMMRIQKDMGSGKLTKTQATALEVQMRAIRNQELDFMKSTPASDVAGQNYKQLTADQSAQLDQSLGQLERSF